MGLGPNSGSHLSAVSSSDLYVGGNFTTAGGKVSPYVARAYLPTLPVLSILRTTTDVTISWPSANTADFVFEQASPLSGSTSWITNSAPVTENSTNRSVTLPATNSPRFFRLRR